MFIAFKCAGQRSWSSGGDTLPSNAELFIKESTSGGGFAKRLSSFHLVQSSAHMIDDCRDFVHALNLSAFLMPHVSN